MSSCYVFFSLFWLPDRVTVESSLMKYENDPRARLQILFLTYSYQCYQFPWLNNKHYLNTTSRKTIRGLMRYALGICDMLYLASENVRYLLTNLVRYVGHCRISNSSVTRPQKQCCVSGDMPQILMGWSDGYSLFFFFFLT